MLSEEETIAQNAQNHLIDDKRCRDDDEAPKVISEQAVMGEFSENDGNEKIPFRLICNETKKNALRTLMFFICLSGVMFSLVVYHLFNTTNRPFEIKDVEIFTGFLMLFLFFTIQLFGIEFYYNKEHKTCVRLLTVLLLSWFGFNMVFIFSRKLIIVAAVLLYPGFYILFVAFLDFLGIRLRPTQKDAGWFVNRIGFLRELRDYYSDDEMLYLVFLGFISFLSLFVIIGTYWIAVILTLFFIISIKTIAKYDPRRGFLYRKFSEGHPKVKSNPITFNFTQDILWPLKLFQCMGSGGIIFVFIYLYRWIKLPFSLLLTIWGVCCWNLIMGEIHIYAVNVLEEIKMTEEKI
jgi:hypothetical protein